MSTTLRSPPSAGRTRDSTCAASRLRTTMAAMRLSFNWFGVRKSLSADQKSQAAQSFGASGEFLSAGKKLFDTRHFRFKAVSAVRRRAGAYFHGVSLPYPEPAIRLVQQHELETIQRRMEQLQEELEAAVADLDDSFEELQAAASEKLGDLYSPADYPRSLLGLFGMTWEFPGVEPPDYLRKLSPKLYQEECRRVTARFEEAAQLAEQMFLTQLNDMISHLAERLAGNHDGKPKIFRDTAVENFGEFFDRFRRLNIGSDEQLELVVEQAQALMRGVQPQALRDSETLRRDVSIGLSRINQSLETLLIDRPRRNLLRSNK